ncbi:MAG: hypothetical protein SFV81_12075 [Pirellulaceae bacterium]|nr:hypothetical protein [Pirellulaceae bacterium]
MNSPAFLLALAPAASAVASRTVSAAKDTGESFVSMLGSVFEAPANIPAVTTAEAKPSLAETLQSFAEKLRTWLSERGAGDDFSIDYHLAPDGESQFNVTGGAADNVKQLLASDPSWLDKLKQLASTMQAKSAQLSRDYTSSSVTIEIDPQHANIY